MRVCVCVRAWRVCVLWGREILSLSLSLFFSLAAVCYTPVLLPSLNKGMYLHTFTSVCRPIVVTYKLFIMHKKQLLMCADNFYRV